MRRDQADTFAHVCRAHLAVAKAHGRFTKGLRNAQQIAARRFRALLGYLSAGVKLIKCAASEHAESKRADSRGRSLPRAAVRARSVRCSVTHGRAASRDLPSAGFDSQDKSRQCRARAVVENREDSRSLAVKDPQAPAPRQKAGDLFSSTASF